MPFKTVAVVGVSGSLGKPVVRALFAAGFKVTAITRETSNATFPDGVGVQRANPMAEHTVTQNQLLRLLEDETGIQFAVTRTNTKDLARARDEKFAKGDPTAFYDAIWAVKEDDSANGVLGLEANDLREIVKEYVRNSSP
ncbi:hypothetical protein C8A00DRAFT_34021 [Chaetomidium leptoderma]|uniref:NmrA-like domain-containing protein n=1 Tax=Chaetomidium leptoderma TaxID=669021 RepID=A0AAN6VL26_9PEZI|nr:hypothetical protein C8A00DRAFT_34021 [Chaetomidium leptoderma]